MNYRTAIKMIGEDAKDNALKERVLKHVKSCPRCRRAVEKKDESNEHN